MNLQYKNILILNLRKIGDTIMATSSAYLLKKAYPEAKITMLVKPLTKSIVENNPVIDEVLLYDYSHKAKWNDIKKSVDELKSKNFDLAVIIDNKPRSAMLSYLAKIPKRIGFEKITLRNIYLKLFYTDIYKIDYDFINTQQVKNHEIFINRITGRFDKAKMVMPNISNESQLKVSSLLDNLSKNRLNVALCIRSGIKFKDWSQENFIKVLNFLNQKYELNFYVVGSANNYDYAQSFIEKSNIDIVNFCGKTNLPELGYLLKQSDLLLSVDTGTAHIAAAQETDTIVIFAGTSHKHWAPYGDKVKVVYPKLSCYPCSDKERKQCKSYLCLENIDINNVIEFCEDIIEEKRK